VDTNFDEQTLAMCQGRSFGVENGGLCPVLAAFAAHQAGFHADGRTGGDRALVVDAQVPRHGGEALGSNCLAHNLVEQGSDDSPVQVAGRSFKGVGNCDGADDGAVCGAQELKVQAAGIGGTAAETAILGPRGEEEPGSRGQISAFRLLRSVHWHTSGCPRFRR